MALMREETFGPILPVMPFRDADEAVALANDSEYGLSGAVFAADEDAARALGRRLDVGAVSVNDAALTALVHEGEKNSFRHSGLGGSRMGDASLRRFVRKQTLIVNHSTARDPWWHTP
jgi:acyl-CoA reductase-like NAD-dependent aldehyde dehydrogenase